MSANERLKKLRIMLKLSQEQLGTAIGLTKSGISSIENGTRILSDKHIKLICAAFPRVNGQWLKTGDGDPFIQSDDGIFAELTDEFNLDEFTQQFLRVVLRLSPQQREVLKTVAFSMVDMVTGDQSLYEEYKSRLKDTEIAEELALYEQELRSEKSIQTSAVSQNTNELEDAKRDDPDMETNKELA